MSDQPCIGCGRETGAGTSLFAGRHGRENRETGDRVWVCAPCVADRVVDAGGASGIRDAFLRGAELGDIAR